MACFCCSATENLIFLLIYLQRKADLNTSEKSLVFVTVQHNAYTIRPAIICESFIFTKKYAFAERCCFLTFSFKGKLRKHDNFVKRKNTKNFSAVSTNFHRTKILSSMHCFSQHILQATVRESSCFVFNSCYAP